jgi:hypothetical protein
VEQSRKSTAERLSGEVWKGLYPSGKFPAHSVPERAVAAQCADKIDFREVTSAFFGIFSKKYSILKEYLL